MVSNLPTLNACLNLLSFALLVAGYVAIKRGQQETHKKLMAAALVSSALFLTSYLIYHYNVPSTPYPHHDWRRSLYFFILIPHIILAALMVPFIIWGVLLAIKQNYLKHARVMRWVWPVWAYVSITGVLVYLMLYVWV